MSDRTIDEDTNIETPEHKEASAAKRKVKRRKLAGEEHSGRPVSVEQEDAAAAAMEQEPAAEAAGQQPEAEAQAGDAGLFFDLPDEPFVDSGLNMIFGKQLFPAETEAVEDAAPEEELPEDEEEPPAEFEAEEAAEEPYVDEEEAAALSEAEEKERRRQEARAKRKAALKKELEEQVRQEREEQARLKAEAIREQKRLEEKARKEKEKQEAKERKEQERQEAKARREQIKQTAEYRRRAKLRNVLLVIAAVIVVLAAAVFLIDQYVKLRQYAVISSVEMTNLDETSQIYPFHDGYVKIAGDGITYFDRGGIIWNESFSMADPICDVCGEYIVATDMKSTEVYVYGSSGFINKFSLTRVAVGAEISRYGTVAVATSEGESNYIELKDMTGKELATVKTVFSSTGYLSDIALSPDGTKLAAAYISVVDGNIESKVVFYDFSKDSNLGENVTIGEFTQYKSSLITSLEFMSGNRLAAVGDNAFTIYAVGDAPSIVYEDLELPWQINSLFFSDRYIGFIIENAEGEDAYAIKAYNLSGRLVCDQTFDFAYNQVAFAGRSVLLYSTYDCDVFNFAGTHKFSYSFDNRIYTMTSCGDGINYLLLGQGQTQFIRLR